MASKDVLTPDERVEIAFGKGQAASKVYQWLKRTEQRQKILLAFKQPMTAGQISKATGVQLDACSSCLQEFAVRGLAMCLTPRLQRGKVYALLDAGIDYRRQLQNELHLPDVPYYFDWRLYAGSCFSQRSAVLKAMEGQMQPAAIKRKARQQNSRVRISANNVRDCMRFLVEWGIAKSVMIRKKAHLHYELTDIGEEYQFLLRRAEQKE